MNRQLKQLFEAIKNKNYKKVQKLINEGVELNINLDEFNGDEQHVTPLVQAVINLDEKMVRLLVENKAYVNHYTPIFSLPMSTNYDKTYFAEGEYEGDEGDEDEKTRIRIFNYLIKNGANLNILDDGGISFLGYCAFNMYIHFMKLALDNGADINIRENVVNYGKNTDGKIVVTHIDHGQTPLISAAGNLSYFSVKFLLDMGALIDLQDDNGNTALMHAASFPDDIEQDEELTNSRRRIIKLLIERGVDVNIKNKEGKTAYELTKNPKLKKLFIKNKFIKEKGSEKCRDSFSVFDQEDHSKLDEVFIFEKDGVFHCYTLEELDFLLKNKNNSKALDPVVPFRYKFFTDSDFEDMRDIFS